MMIDPEIASYALAEIIRKAGGEVVEGVPRLASSMKRTLTHRAKQERPAGRLRRRCRHCCHRCWCRYQRMRRANGDGQLTTSEILSGDTQALAGNASGDDDDQFLTNILSDIQKSQQAYQNTYGSSPAADTADTQGEIQAI